MRHEYTIGNESYVPVNGPGSSYYTSVCEMCDMKTPQLYEWRRTSQERVLMCPRCYRGRAVRDLKPYRPPPDSVQPWDVFWVGAFITSVVALVVLIVWFTWFLVSG